jgi:co-chaperonin GroES (HSP10)
MIQQWFDRIDAAEDAFTLRNALLGPLPSGRYMLSGSGLVLESFWTDPLKHQGLLAGDLSPVGSGRFNSKGVLIPLHVRAGERVLYQRHGAVEDESDGEGVLVMAEDNLLAVIDEPSAS